MILVVAGHGATIVLFLIAQDIDSAIDQHPPSLRFVISKFVGSNWMVKSAPEGISVPSSSCWRSIGDLQDRYLVCTWSYDENVSCIKGQQTVFWIPYGFQMLKISPNVLFHFSRVTRSCWLRDKLTSLSGSTGKVSHYKGFFLLVKVVLYVPV